MRLCQRLMVIVSVFTFMIVSGQYSHSQQTLSVSELESAKLGKLRAQVAVAAEKQHTIDAQINMLQKQRDLTEIFRQQKYSEFLGYAESIKKEHIVKGTHYNSDWECGKICTVDFNPDAGEDGIFTKNPVKKEVKNEGQTKDFGPVHTAPDANLNRK